MENPDSLKTPMTNVYVDLQILQADFSANNMNMALILYCDLLTIIPC